MNQADIKIQNIALNTIEVETDAILKLKNSINNQFIECIKFLHSINGRVVVTGMGKSAIIANKITATLNSTGTPALFMHAADAIHGDLGMIRKEDAVIIISRSGETPEVKMLVPLLKIRDNKLIAMTGNISSFLAIQADFVLDTSVNKEACPYNLAPTASTTAQLVLGDAIAVCLLELKGFTEKDFALLHPGGMLGKKLYLRVDDLYIQHEAASVSTDADINTVIMEITSKRLGATAVTDGNGKLTGIITDGDLRRMMEKMPDILRIRAKDIMTSNPITIQSGELAFQALQMMKENKITQIIVMNGNNYLGMVHLHDIIREGIL